MTRYLTLALGLLLSLTATRTLAHDVVVLGGVDEVIEWMQANDWWGEARHGEQMSVPPFLITRVSDTWATTAQKLPVPVKKEVFYRAILPLVVHANDMVRDRRQRMESMLLRVNRGEALGADEQRQIAETASLLRISVTEPAAILEQALYKLDEIPAGLVLGQAAYESGYGTSRFAMEGNALFGQWTYGGEGLVPEQQREHLGDHRIAAYDWPFDSVRAYYLNISAHPAYEKLRRIRAELKAAGKPVTSLALADGLTAYSERGEAYVETLKGIIRVNRLDVADDAYFRDGHMKLLIGAAGPEEAARIRGLIGEMQASGELDAMIREMRLE